MKKPPLLTLLNLAAGVLLGTSTVHVEKTGWLFWFVVAVFFSLLGMMLGLAHQTDHRLTRLERRRRP